MGEDGKCCCCGDHDKEHKEEKCNCCENCTNEPGCTCGCENCKCEEKKEEE